MSTSKFQKLVNNNFLFRFYLLKSLPLAFVAGIRVKELINESCVTTVKYCWLTQNPFRSMYFACQTMAAEMSTGLLLINHIYKSTPRVSMLIVQNKAVYHKKAVGRITFVCLDGTAIFESINKAKSTSESVLIDTIAIGKDESGDIVAEFTFTWSVKIKNKNI